MNVDAYIAANHDRMSLSQMSKELGLAASTISQRRARLGFKKLELEFWTPAQEAWLKRLYKYIGDVELALIFDEAYPKKKGWTLKHIEKKRLYLGLKRTPAQLKAIKQRNKGFGFWAVGNKHTWESRGVAPEGDIRYWLSTDRKRMIPVIKVNGRFIHWAPYVWKQHYGKVPNGMNVVFKDDNPYNRLIQNLELITNAELARRNFKKSSTGLSDNYVAGILTHGNPELRSTLKNHPELIELKRQQLLLNRTIYEQVVS